MHSATPLGWKTLAGRLTTLTTTEMNIPTLDFTGDATTFLGLIGIVSTAIILVAAFRKFGSSPLRD